MQSFVVSSSSDLEYTLSSATKSSLKEEIKLGKRRHIFVTLILTAGSDIYTTSKLLGHTSIHTTKIYANIVM